MYSAEAPTLVVYGTSFNPYSQETVLTRRALILLQKYQPGSKVTFADINQEIVRAHCPESLLEQSILAESLSRVEVAKLLKLMVVLPDKLSDSEEQYHVEIPQIYLQT